MHLINKKLVAALKLINEAAEMERALYCPAPSGVPAMGEEDASLAHRLIGCICHVGLAANPSQGARDDVHCGYSLHGEPPVFMDRYVARAPRSGVFT